MTEYLAHRGGYPHWYRQVNRNMGVLAQHSNSFLSRIRPTGSATTACRRAMAVVPC